MNRAMDASDVLKNGCAAKDSANSTAIACADGRVSLGRSVKRHMAFFIRIGIVLLCLIPVTTAHSVAFSEEDYSVLMRQAHAALEQQDYSVARKKFMHVLDHRNNDAHLLRSLGQVSWKEADYDDAIVWYEKALSLNEQDSASLQALGAIWAEKAIRLKEGESGRQAAWEMSLFYYDLALEYMPNNPALLLGKAYAHYWLGEVDDAASFFEYVLEQDQTNSFLHVDEKLAVKVALRSSQDAIQNRIRSDIKSHESAYAISKFYFWEKLLYLQSGVSYELLRNAFFSWTESKRIFDEKSSIVSGFIRALIDSGSIKWGEWVNELDVDAQNLKASFCALQEKISHQNFFIDSIDGCVAEDVLGYCATVLQYYVSSFWIRDFF